ncbi:hypothetical protein [Micromonospora sp. KC606]|uniref:hypothetical protein n=1 Tax=Micromonospora sp. KC606 TaxID=2530379 RepID=UPI001404CF04|nr:hypothetical protein [Micromonospora sp. KC606]
MLDDAEPNDDVAELLTASKALIKLDTGHWPVLSRHVNWRASSSIRIMAVARSSAVTASSATASRT